VLALPRDLKANLLKRPDSPKVGDPRYLRHKLSRNFHFPQVLPARQVFSDCEVLANRVLNVRQSFLFRCALRPAPGETGARDAIPLFSSYQSNWVLHTSNSNISFGASLHRHRDFVLADISADGHCDRQVARRRV
jgi:hypothetical protein